jgi:hypothetical protein
VKEGINGNYLNGFLQMQQKVANLQEEEELKLPQLVIMTHKSRPFIVLVIVEGSSHH